MLTLTFCEIRSLEIRERILNTPLFVRIRVKMELQIQIQRFWDFSGILIVRCSSIRRLPGTDATLIMLRWKVAVYG